MPPPLRNPNWRPDNGQPEWVSYGPPNPNYVGQNQSNMPYSTRGTQPRLVPSAGMRPNTAIPFNSGLPAHLPADLAFNTSVPFHDSVPHGTGTPTNTGVPPNIATSINAGTTQNSIGGSSTPGLGATTDVHTYGPAFEPGNEDRSWEATLDQTRKLLRLKGKRYGRHVKSFEDHKRLKKARKHLLRKNTVDRSGDMPQDFAGQQVLVERLINAMSNLDEIETRKTRKHTFRHGRTRIIDSIGVRCVKEMNEFDMEMLAWDFMVAIRDAQRGHLELPAKFKFENYDTFMERFDDLESCLRVNKHLIRSALQSNEWVDRIAANPRGERSKKKSNDKINSMKLDQLAQARQLKKDCAAGFGMERQGSTDTLPEKRGRLSLASDIESMQGQAQPQLEQQQFQLPQEPGMHLQAFEYLQQPQQHFHDYSQHVNIQPVTIHLHYGNLEQYGHPKNHRYSEQYGNPQQQFEGRLEHGNPQQLASPQPSENHVQIENREYLAQPQHRDGNAQQHGDAQGLEIPAHHKSPQQNQSPQQPQQSVNSEPLEHTQQHGSPQQQDQQPASVPEPVAAAAATATPVTYDGPQSS